ncbi:hypothetical protein [Flavobacterium reichenbachii]|uniref:HTH araC/xylS-type domain-containing protein n=1 Tax=Flavobacterium reichenbachii TaxID=362418 RepID=A0A085ZIT1_9FLAO|nr:hypothetical protein [Flavobacterium reichenbachii]KFF04345.1 hypothetical protein IW19_01845 [Flavobacterium reichenbachii]OXB11667.1 hypothetical protein B0A68_20715 [Flavobacterium reichenbachii]
MKKLYLNTGKFDVIFNDLKDTFGGKMTTNANEYKLTFKSKWANGTISGARFEKEMTYLNFDLTFDVDVNLSIESNPFAPIYFAYCQKGSFTHSFGINGQAQILKQNQTGIMNNTSAINSVLHFESHKHIQFSLVGVPTFAEESAYNFDFTTELKKKFTHESGNFIYVGGQHLKISQKMQELNTIPQQGTVRTLLMRSILRDILELEIAQHSYNYLNAFNPIVNLAVRQLNEIKRISHMNFSEVVYAAGSASRKFVPRIFKEKYHLSYKPYGQKLAS